MKTKLEHADELLKAKAGTWLVVHEPISGTNISKGGVLHYTEGARLRVKFTSGGLWCEDEDARTVAFDKADLHALDWAT